MHLLETLELLRKARKLFDIEVDEVSLVENPANFKRFLIVKNDGTNIEKDNTMDKELLELLKAFIGNEEDEELEEVLKAAVPKQVVASLKSALKVMNTYKDTLPDDLVKSMTVIAKYAAAGYGYPQPTKKSEEEIADALEKAGKKVSKDTIKEMVAALKTIHGGLDMLNKILPEESRVTKAEEELSKEAQALVDVKATVADLKDQIIELTKSPDDDKKAKGDDEKDKDKTKGDDEDADKGKDSDVEELTKRIKDLEKDAAKKKSLDDDDEGEDQRKWRQ